MCTAHGTQLCPCAKETYREFSYNITFEYQNQNREYKCLKWLNVLKMQKNRYVEQMRFFDFHNMTLHLFKIVKICYNSLLITMYHNNKNIVSGLFLIRNNVDR